MNKAPRIFNRGERIHIYDNLDLRYRNAETLGLSAIQILAVALFSDYQLTMEEAINFIVEEHVRRMQEHEGVSECVIKYLALVGREVVQL